MQVCEADRHEWLDLHSPEQLRHQLQIVRRAIDPRQRSLDCFPPDPPDADLHQDPGQERRPRCAFGDRCDKE